MSLLSLISLWILIWLIMIWLPSWIVFFLLFFLILLHLVLIYFNIISSVLSLNIRVCWLLSSMVKSWFLFCFCIFKFLLSLVIEILFGLFCFISLFVLIRKISLSYFSLVVFHFSSYFCVINAFKVFLNSVFTILCV